MTDNNHDNDLYAYESVTEAATKKAAGSRKPQSLHEALAGNIIPRTLGETGSSDAVPVVRMAGQVFADELAAAEAHHGRRLAADERELLAPFIGEDG